MRIGDLSTQRVVTIGPDESVLTATRLMRDEHVGDVVVVDRTDTGMRPIGIVTDRDIVVGIIAQGISDLTSLRARDAMGRQLQVVSVDEDVFRAIRLMSEHSVRRLPVVNALGVLVGIVTYDDLIRELAQYLASFTRNVVRQEDVERARRAGS